DPQGDLELHRHDQKARARRGVPPVLRNDGSKRQRAELLRELHQGSHAVQPHASRSEQFQSHQLGVPTMKPSVLLVMLLLSIASGCARLKPYERGRLAHPTMLLG